MLSSDVNECFNNPCKNGANCINMEGNFRCLCLPQWTGKLCDTGKCKSVVGGGEDGWWSRVAGESIIPVNMQRRRYNVYSMR